MERYRGCLNINILLAIISGFTGLLCAAEAPGYKLACLNDYVVTIRCELNISVGLLHDGNGSYWLEFEGGDKKTFECPLVNQTDHYSCTFKSTERFIDTEYFMIAFCTKKNADKSCLDMDKRYKPIHHIKPIAPINFKVNQSSGHYWFTWDSGYEGYIPKTFMKRLKYRLQYYKHGHPDNVQTIHAVNRTQRIDGSEFEPGMEYIARVCSSPEQVHYTGHWSEWSAAVKWRTSASQDATPSAEAVLLSIGYFFFPACVLGSVLAIICFRSIDRCRIKSHSNIPTPAPYFQPIYSKYNGDFQSWLVSQGNVGQPFMMEETVTVEAVIDATPMVNKELFLPRPSITLDNICGAVKQDKLDTPPSRSIQNSSIEVFLSLPPGCCVCSGEEYCILTDTNNDLTLTAGTE